MENIGEVVLLMEPSILSNSLGLRIELVAKLKDKVLEHHADGPGLVHFE